MLVAVASAKGAPGATTTARVLASVWPGDVLLADCDPAGGDVALQARGPGGAVLDPERGLLSLGADARRGLAADALGEHLQLLEGGLPVLVGVGHPEQVTGIGAAWPTMAAVFANARATVVADCGRVLPGTPVLPVLQAADAVLFVVRPRIEAYAHLRERLRWLLAAQPPGRRPGLGVVVVTEPRDSGAPADLGRLLAREGLDATVVGHLARDDRAADVLGGRVDRSIGRSLLVRSARTLVAPVQQLAAASAAAVRY